MTLPALNEKRLAYFFETVSKGSMRAAAEALEVEASVVSRQIQQLEADVGTVLLERRGRGVVPTDAGLLVMQLCEDRRLGEDTLRHRLWELQGLERGELRIVVGEGFLPALMDGVIHAFTRRYPRILVAVDTMGSSEAVREVSAGRANLGIALSAPADPGVHVVRERHQPVCVVASPQHPVAKGKRAIALADLAGHALALTTPGSGLRMLAQTAERADGIRLMPSFTSNSVDALKRHVIATESITFLTRFAIRQELASGELIARRTSNPVFEAAHAQLFVQQDRRASAALQALLKMAESARFLANPPAGPGK